MPPGAAADRRRPADPPFPRAVKLLGQMAPLDAPRTMPHRHRALALAAVRGAARKLAAEAAAGRLAAEDIGFLRALRRLTLGQGRSGQWRGTFIVGLADVRATSDPAYWASALVHDGVHAHRQARGRRFRDEVGPCEAQIAYLQRTGGPEALIAHIAAFRDSCARQRARRTEPS